MTLLTPEVLSWLGHSITFRSDPISLSEARRFIAASGDDNPLYAIPDVGEEAGEETRASPLLYYGITRPLAAADDFAEDGTVAEHRPLVGTGQTMGGSMEVEWFEPLKLDDQLEGTRTLASLQEKKGRKRDFVVAEWVTEYRDKTGRLLVRERYEQILF